MRTDFGAIDPSTNATPNRKTEVLFDLNNSYVTEQAFSFGRPAKLMFRQAGSSHNELEFTIGWGIKAYHESLGLIHERTEAAGTLTPESGDLICPSGLFESVYTTTWDSTTEMPGVLTGASGNISNPGGQMVRKKIPAGTNWSTVNLAPDQAAFPFTPPSDAYGIDNTIKMDRIAVTKENDTQERNLFFVISIYGNPADDRGEATAIYFTGPAGKNDKGTGVGLYRLSINANERCVLYERQAAYNSTWIKRYEFAMPSPTSSHGRLICLTIIKSKTCTQPDLGAGGFIKFDFFMGSTIDSVASNKLLHAYSDYASINYGIQHRHRYHYAVPGDGTAVSSVNQPVRLDFRRDLLGAFQLNWYKYPTSLVTADDAPFQLPFAPVFVTDDANNPTNNFTFSWTRCLQSGDTCYATLHRVDTGAELTSLGASGLATLYAVPAGVRDYFVRWHIQTGSSNHTPIALDYKVTREAVITNTGNATWKFGDATHLGTKLQHISTKGAERDLSHASAEISVADPLNTLTEFHIRAGMPMRIQIQYDSVANPSKVVVPFMGFMDRADAFRRPPGPNGYPVLGWNMFKLMCKGIWQVLEENFIDTPILTLIDQTTNTPFGVKKFLKDIISRAGFNKSTAFDPSFDTDDIPIIASNLDYSQSIDMLDKVSDVAKSLARDYLSQFLIHDPNVSVSSGVWRLKDIPTSPYTNVASFTMNGPSSSPALVHYLPSYGTIVDTESGLDIPVIPIDKGSVNTAVKYPEANWLMVAAVGVFGGADSAEIYTAFKFDPISFNYQGTSLADPTQPEYLGRRLPIYVVDPALGAAGSRQDMIDAVNALATRIAKLTFKAVKTMKFRAPFVPVANEAYGDGIAFEKRDIRYYDPVLVDGTQWLVRNVNLDYRKDSVQYAMYELEAPREGEDWLN